MGNSSFSSVDSIDGEEGIHDRCSSIVFGNVSSNDIVALRKANSVESILQFRIILHCLCEHVDSGIHVEKETVVCIFGLIFSSRNAYRVDSHHFSCLFRNGLHSAIETRITHSVRKYNGKSIIILRGR